MKSRRLRRRILEAEVINPAKLTAMRRNVVARRLYSLHQRIFAGVSIEVFADYVFRPDAVRTRIQIYRNERGYVVSCCAHAILELVWEARAYGVFRAETGLLEAYRGSPTTFRFGGWETLRYKVLHPQRTTLLFATPVHP